MQRPAPAPTHSGPPVLSDVEKEKRDRVLADASKDLAEARAHLVATNIETENGLLTALRYCSAHDRIMKKIFQWATRLGNREHPRKPPLCLVALGGYGRRQLNLYSDIDLLFLLPSSNSERAELELRLMLYVLYDLKLDLGNITRTIDETLDCVGIDFDSTTALIESRWLAGDRKLFEQMRRKLKKRLCGERRRWFMNEVINRRDLRHQNQGSSVYMLEPNLKESEGGLRDLHTVAWLSFLSSGDSRLRALVENKTWTMAQLREARKGRSFLLRMRNELHAMEGRRVDVLRLPKHAPLAERLGYQRDDLSLAEEKMLHDYYLVARSIYGITESAVNQIARVNQNILQGVVDRWRRRSISKEVMALGRIAFLADEHADWLRRDPANLWELAALVAENDLRFSEKTKVRMRRAVDMIDEEARRDMGVRDLFMRILKSPHNVAYTLRILHEIKALEAYLPEWEHLFCLVRSDMYHSYTVDEHHLKCLEAVEFLRANLHKEDPRLRAAAANIARWDLLNLSLLLHDVAKGMGGAHALRGAQIAEKIAFRLNLDDADRSMLRFLIFSHLKLSHVAQRRDLLDERVVEDFAREVGDLDRLRMLYIHTVCDMRGVGPNVYNDWRAQLLGMLYERAQMVLQGRPLVQVERPRVMPGLRAEMIGALSDKGYVEDDISDFLDSLPDRYFADATVEKATSHFVLTRALTQQNRIEWQLRQPPDTNYSELLLACYDEPGVFSKICGALASKEINILSAQIHSTSDGFAVDTFQVTNDEYNRLPEGFRIDRLKRNLNDVLLGRASIEDLIAKSRTVRRVSPHRARHKPAQIDIDNDASITHTILEIHAHDRTGLLYDITRVIHEKKLSIDLALIATEAYTVVDVLYVTDTEGNKLYSDNECDALSKALLGVIEA